MQKTAPKKAVPSVTADVDPEKAFWLSDGRMFKNLRELAAAFETMEDSVWDYHVTAEKNDFANWIENVFGENQLGGSIRKVKSPRTAAKRIQSKLEIPKFWSFLM
ncbi:MAG: hypothetical protein WCX69_02170 [Candidatus Paceibacterota bacterium]